MEISFDVFKQSIEGFMPALEAELLEIQRNPEARAKLGGGVIDVVTRGDDHSEEVIINHLTKASQEFPFSRKNVEGIATKGVGNGSSIPWTGQETTSTVTTTGASQSRSRTMA